MEIIQKSAWVAASPEKVYNLVADIEAYPSFLPWCGGAKILKRFDDGVEASLTLTKGGLSKSFITRNKMMPFKKIDMKLVAGPFKSFDGVWSFVEERGGTRVSLDLRFSFESRLIAMMIGPLFQPVANTLLEAFVKRAEQNG